MREDYKTYSERVAYNKGMIAHINSLTESDNPFILKHNRKAWLAGFNEKGSVSK